MHSNAEQILPFEETLQVALNFLEDMDTPKALAVSLLIKYHLIDQYEPEAFAAGLDCLEVNPQSYDQFSISQLRDDYCAVALLSKLPPRDNSDSLRDVAIAGFKAAEEANKLINGTWMTTDDGKPCVAYKLLDEAGTSIESIRSRMSTILGTAPPLAAILSEGVWTIGASVGLSRAKASGELKAEKGITITYPLARAINSLIKDGYALTPLINSRTGWFLVPGNLVSTVPKNIKTDRTIAMEPEINSLCQRSIGIRISKALRKYGIDLNDQTLNQRACMRAYKQRYATLDIRNASNSVLLFPVLSCLPPDWFNLIELCRSAYGTMDSRKHVLKHEATWFEYNMLSSMGNGFTFELESLLFFVLALCAGSPMEDTYIYGDDIIVPQMCVTKLKAILSVFGFEVNAAKSFVSGAFFESCGAYSFFGVDVTPIKIKDLLNEKKNVIILTNKIRLYAHCCRNNDGCDKRFLPSWQSCLSRLPSHIRKHCRGPVGSGLVIYTNVNESNCTYSRKKGALRVSQLTPTLIGESHRLDSDGSEGLFHYRLWEQNSRRSPQMCSERKGNILKLTAVFTRNAKVSPLFIEGPWYELGHWK